MRFPTSLDTLKQNPYCKYTQAHRVMAERQFGQQLLESDGCNPSFFYLLSKENKRTLKSCEMYIPQTILFEQGYVKALFTTEQAQERPPVGDDKTAHQGTKDKDKDPTMEGWANDAPGEIKKKSGKDVDLQEVFEQLVGDSKEGDIVAELLFAKAPGGEMNCVQFLDQKMLHRFLFVDVDKPKSILQKFIRPKGNNNFKILATWSPLMIMAEGRRCPNSLTSRHLPVSIRGATFEDPTLNSVEVVVNRTVVRGINEICCEMAAHFERTEKLSLTRFGGFFKVDENNKLYLMYPTSMRMYEADAVDKTRPPVNLSSKVDIAKTDIATRPKEVLAKKAIDNMDAILKENDAKMNHGSMIINVPSLEDNYTLIRHALHGTKVSRGVGRHELNGTNGRKQGKPAHGVSSVYIDGPLPAGMNPSTYRSSSSLANTTGGTSNFSPIPVQQRANSSMGVHEKGIGPHNNTAFLNSKPSVTSSRKTFYSSNLAGEESNQMAPAAPPRNNAPHRAEASFGSTANASKASAANSSYDHPVATTRQGHSSNRSRQIVTVMPDVPLPQSRPLMRYQHVLPTSEANMVAPMDSNNTYVNNTVSMASGQPLTLRQLNKRTEKQIQGEWQSFIDQSQADLRHWEMKEKQSAMRAARGLTGSDSPTMKDANQRLAALEAAQLQKLGTALGIDDSNSPHSGSPYSSRGANAPPPVKAHSVYDPKRPHKALHLSHGTELPGSLKDQQGLSPIDGLRNEEQDKSSYMRLVRSRANPSAGTNRAVSPSGARNETGPVTPPPVAVDYDADARTFLDSVQREYQQYNTYHPGTSDVIKDAQHSLSKVSRSVLLPSVFSPTRTSANTPMGANSSSAAPSPTRQTTLGSARFTAASNMADKELPAPSSGFSGPTSVNRPAGADSPKAGRTSANKKRGGQPLTSFAPIAKQPSSNEVLSNEHSFKVSNVDSADVRSGLTSAGGATQFTSNSKLFAHEAEATRLADEQRTLEIKRTEIAILLQNLPPTEREKLEAQCNELVAEFKQYLGELAYALYDFFLARREGVKSHRFAYLEVPAKFQGFVSVPTLNKILWKLHGKVQPSIKFLADTMPQSDPNYRDVCDWRRFLLGNLQVGSLGRNWPCRGNFQSIGEYLEYCTTPILSTGGLVDAAIALGDVGGLEEADGGEDGVGKRGESADEKDFSGHRSKSPIAKRTEKVNAIIPVSAVRRQSILVASNPQSSNALSFPKASHGTGSRSATPSVTSLAAIMQQPGHAANKGFSVKELIAKHKEEKRKHKMSLISQRMATELQMKRRRQQEARAAGIELPDEPTDDAASLEYMDELDLDENEEDILEDETIRSINKVYCIVIPLLDEKGLEIVQTEVSIVAGDAAKYLDEDHGIIPLYAKWYLLDKLNESSHRDERVAQKRKARRELLKKQEALQKQSLKREELASSKAVAEVQSALTSKMASAFGSSSPTAENVKRTVSSNAKNEAVPVAAAPTNTKAPLNPTTTAPNAFVPSPLDIICQRCNNCRILCVCDKVYIASGGAKLRPVSHF